MEPETPENPNHRHPNSAVDFLLYGMSLPERALRSTIGVTAGAAREAAQILVPRSFQSGKTYEIVIRNSLRFLTEDIGGTEQPKVVGSEPESEQPPENYVARKAVGNFVDMAGLATLHLSPVWLMAVVSDVAYGSKTYLQELSRELRDKGIIAEESIIASADDLLDAVRDGSGKAATMFDTPPLSADQLKNSLMETKAAIAHIDLKTLLPHKEVQRYWTEMRDIARTEKVGILDVSSAMTMHTLARVGKVGHGALTTMQVAGGLLTKNILGHYKTALVEIHQCGYYTTVKNCSGPYIKAVWNNFSRERDTLTQDVFSGRLWQRIWRSITNRFRARKAAKRER